MSKMMMTTLLMVTNAHVDPVNAHDDGDTLWMMMNAHVDPMNVDDNDDDDDTVDDGESLRRRCSC